MSAFIALNYCFYVVKKYSEMIKILDFSTGNLDELNPEILWEKEIQDFLKDWNSDSEFIISKTSGSTGIPKEIKIPKSAMKLSAELTAEFFNLKKGNSALLCLPVNFIAGKMMLARAIETGLKLFCTEPKSKISFENLAKIDFVPMTPMQVENSFDELTKIKILLIGGAPLNFELKSKLKNLPAKVFESYGMTETITHIALKEISEEYFTVLKQMKIRQDERNCLIIKTPYFEEEITTNDVVKIKNESEFKWLGRFDNVINSGGIKLFPEKIEEKLKPFISDDFIVASLPDKILGEKLILIIESASTTLSNQTINFSHPELVEGQNSELKKHEIPKEVHFIEKFPRTESGKIKRNELLNFIKT
jgi:O-succinylbenzoic acid--CoA ligase